MMDWADEIARQWVDAEKQPNEATKKVAMIAQNQYVAALRKAKADGCRAAATEMRNDYDRWKRSRPKFDDEKVLRKYSMRAARVSEYILGKLADKIERGEA